MRTTVIAAVGLAFSLTLTLSLLRGQAPPPVPAPKPEVKLSPAQVQLQFAARRGADWLSRMHGVKGRFLPGYLPALKQEVEGDDLMRQASAAAGLGRAARYLGEEGYAARAAQAALALFEDTHPDPTDPACRLISMPGDAVSRLAASAALVLAVHDLPAPQSDLLEKAEQLINAMRKEARADGSLGDADPVTAGLAVWAVAKSHKARPAAWKPALAAKSLAFYRAGWEKGRSTEAAHGFAAACAETYLATADKAAAAFAFDIADWACGLQYTTIDRRRLAWYGGFMAWRGGRPMEDAPDVRAGSLAAGLVEACRVAREAGDAARLQRYTGSLGQSLQFLPTLQYTDAGTQHFSVWYRPKVVGGFHASPTDGDLRIDHTADAVTALVGYVEHVAR
ncbi:MAG: hypothetical protein ACRC33_28690 [Gemmataceae bacterium]